MDVTSRILMTSLVRMNFSAHYDRLYMFVFLSLIDYFYFDFGNIDWFAPSYYC